LYQFHDGLAHQRIKIQSPSLIARHVTIRTDFINSMVDLRHEEYVSFCFLHWLGTSPFEQISSTPWWTCAMKNTFLFAFFIGSARPPFERLLLLETVLKHRNSVENMQKWKYMQSNKEPEWNKFGKSGWELISVVVAKDGSYLGFFKKPLN
jgi:hypothetical protein